MPEAARLGLVVHPEAPQVPLDPFAWLQKWYASHCDGDWEHDERIEIGSIDNPGWRVRIGLVDTALEARSFERLRVERDADDWIHAWVEGQTYNAACGLANLGEALSLFRDWASA